MLDVWNNVNIERIQGQVPYDLLGVYVLQLPETGHDGLPYRYSVQLDLTEGSHLGFAMQCYIISSWHGWVQGDAFGGRMFIVCTPIFAMGLAHLIEWTHRRWGWLVVYVVGGLLLVWNFLLFVEYRFDLVTAQRLPRWYDLTIRRVTFLVDLIVRIWR